MPAATCAATQQPSPPGLGRPPRHAPSLRHPWHDQPRNYHAVAQQHDLAGSNAASVGVHYRDGKVVLEVGARATPTKLNFESLKVRVLLKFQHKLTWSERLLQRIGWTKQRLPALPSYGTWAFEAHLELLTLERMRLDVEGIKAQLQAGAQVIEDGKPIEIEAVDAKLYDVAKQFEAYQAHLSNLAQGRGMIETQAGRVRTTVDEILVTPVSPQDLATFAQREPDGAAAMAEERAKATQSKIGAAPSDAASNRRALVATALGEKARYAARVGPDTGHPTFGKPWSDFVFATAYSDLAGLNAIDMMVRVGWTPDAIAKWALNVDIVRTIIDVSIPINGKQLELEHVTWPEVRKRALVNADFLKVMKQANIEPATQEKLFDILATGHLAEAQAKAEKVGLGFEMGEVTKWLEKNYSINRLYTGEGYTKTEQGEAGAREFMVIPNGTGLALTADNHSKVSLGKITEEDFEKAFGYMPNTKGTP